MIEDNFDIPFAADLARREKQIQQNYRPIIAIHKWFARRPGTLFRALLLSEFSPLPLKTVFYQRGDLSGKTIADPFMGGGTPLIEANRMGADIQGCDINPMAWWIVRREMEFLDVRSYREKAEELRNHLEENIGSLYRTNCVICGSDTAQVKYFLWVKTMPCNHCGKPVDLFPGYLLSENIRHPLHVFVCPQCGTLTEAEDQKTPGSCRQCGTALALEGPARKGRCACKNCHSVLTFPGGADAPFSHRLFALEYHCPVCGDKHKGRFFKAPDAIDIAKTREAERRLEKARPRFIPGETIPAGDETNRLRRWGYRKYRELFNQRQLLGLETSCRYIADEPDERIRNALATNLSDLLRYQNMLCRYDTSVLKSLDIFSVHGFPVGLIQCESNLLGIRNGGGLPMGSGGWLNIIEKYTKAKRYCAGPFEIMRHEKTGKKDVIPIPGEWIGDAGNTGQSRRADVSCRDAAAARWKPDSLDGVFTDPPYFGNVQYAELMDFCYVWLRKLVSEPAFNAVSTRNERELTGNDNMQRGLEHFTGGLSQVFSHTARALKKNAPFVFTYHHNDIAAYFPVAAAILDAGLYCSKVLPCPAEMSASIHIRGTGSSIIDSIFVCRMFFGDAVLPQDEDIAVLLREDIAALRQAPYTVTPGDARCIAYGHIIRLIINTLVPKWKRELEPSKKLNELHNFFMSLGGNDLLKELAAVKLDFTGKQKERVNEFTFV
jgi:adenine-specific DNA methylase